MKNGKKNEGGRPPKYETPEEMLIKMDEYFSQCKPEFAKDGEGNILTAGGNPIIINLNSPSLSGLTLYLGFADRQSLRDNEKRDGFSFIIKNARTKVEEWVYQHTVSGSIPAAAGIFILKQFGYSDKKEIQHSTIDENGEPAGFKFVDPPKKKDAGSSEET